MKSFDVIVIGGGQSGLAVGYYLRRAGLSFVILDNETESGGSWLHTWKSLRLFSPAQWSALPGMQMKTASVAGNKDYYPTRDETIAYLKEYESRYALPVYRNVQVEAVNHTNDYFKLLTSDGEYISKAVVSATGTFGNAHIPFFEGHDSFKGEIIHSSQYLLPVIFKNKKVAIVGEGNSGAQILAEVSGVTDTIWITQKEPRFLPDHVDGRYLFDAATQMYEAQKAGKQYKPPSLGDIVMVDTVREARSRGVLESFPPFARFSQNGLVWNDGQEQEVDVVIFCTGFKPALQHLAPLNVVTAEGRVETEGTGSRKVNGLWLVGYGNWTGFASATLIGVGRSAKATVEEITKYFSALHRKATTHEHNDQAI